MNTNNSNSKFSRRQILKYGNFALATGVTTLAISYQINSEPEIINYCFLFPVPRSLK
ncbi:MAG: hypothetical protein AB4080_02770 [Trichodesmium sp.]